MVLPAILLGLGALYLFLSGDDDDGPAPVLPPGGDDLPPGAYEGLTEVRMVDGQPVRYFRPQIATAILGMLGESWSIPLPPGQSQIADPNVGLQVVHQSSMAPPGAGTATALQVAQLSAQQGLSILGSLSLAQPTDTGDRWIAVVRPIDVASYARDGGRWAVLLDPARGVMPTPPGVPGGGGGGGGGITPPPPPPPPPPPGPGGGSTQQLDAYMPAELRAKIVEMLGDSGMEPTALEQLANQIESDYPLAATALRARAAQLRAIRKAEAFAKGGWEFTIRYGDLPSLVAQHYTGDGLRWKEIAQANKGMKVLSNGLDPWYGTILLPLSWEPWKKGLPPVATGTPGGGSSDDTVTADWPTGGPHADVPIYVDGGVAGAVQTSAPRKKAAPRKKGKRPARARKPRGES